MRKILQKYLLFFVFLSPVVAFADNVKGAQQKTAKKRAKKSLSIKEKDLEEFSRKLKSHKVLEINFIQKTYRNLRKKTRRTKGRAVFIDGRKFRWVVKGLSPIEWIYDGTSLVSFQPNEKYATRYPSTGSQGQEFRKVVEMVTDLKKLRETYKLVHSEKKGQKGTLKLEPFSGKASGDIQKIEIQLNFKKYYIDALKITFRQGNYSDFTFVNPVFKAFHKEALNLPKGVKIVDAL